MHTAARLTAFRPYDGLGGRSVDGASKTVEEFSEITAFGIQLKGRDDGSLSYSDIRLFGTVVAVGGAPDDTEAPSTPVNLIASDTTAVSTTLSWDASSDNVAVVGYEIFQDGVSIGTSPVNTMTVSGLSPETDYSFTVTASDAAGNTSLLSTALIVTTAAEADITPPSVPVGLLASNVGTSTLDLSWDASSDNTAVASYEVLQDGISIGSTDSTALAISGLLPGTVYNFTVVASDAAGNTSAASSPLTVTTSMLSPATIDVLGAVLNGKLTGTPPFTLRRNGVTIPVEPDGTFSLVLDMPAAQITTVDLEVTDGNGQSAIRSVEVNEIEVPIDNQ